MRSQHDGSHNSPPQSTGPLNSVTSQDPPQARRPPRFASRRQRWFARFLVIAVALGIALLFGEAVLRIAAPQQLVQVRPDIWVSDDEGLGWRMASHLDTDINTGEGTVRLATDGRGYRVDPTAAMTAIEPATNAAASTHNGPLRILVLGDSFAAALQVEAEAAFPEILGGDLEHRLERPVEVTNASCGEWGPSHYRIVLRRELEAAEGARRPYDLVVVAFFLGNDIEPWSVGSFAPRQTSRSQGGLRWPSSLSANALKGAWLYPINNTLEQHSHLYQLFKKGSWQLLMRLGLSARRVSATDLAQNADDPRWELTARTLAEMATLANAADVPLLVGLIPSAVHTDPEIAAAYGSAVGLPPDGLLRDQARRKVTAALESHEIPMVDTTDALRRLHQPWKPTHGRVDTHLTVRGHRGVASELVPAALSLMEGSWITPADARRQLLLERMLVTPEAPEISATASPSETPP